MQSDNWKVCLENKGLFYASSLRYHKKAMCYLLLLLLFFSSLACAQTPMPGPRALTVEAKPITWFEKNNHERTHFGALEFRGGLVLSSTDSRFGGLSALNMDADGENFLAISDRGYWLRGRVVYKDGRPTGLADTVMAPILDDKGAYASSWDTEGMTRDGDIRYISIERIHEIARFDWGAAGFAARGNFIPTPEALKKLPYNKGLEAIVFAPPSHPLAGALIAASEGALDENGNLRAFIIGGPQPGTFAIKASKKFEISDATLLPDGDMLILERYYSVLDGLFARIRRIAKAEITPGAIIEGRTLFEVDNRCEIDNQEAISVHRNQAGEIILTLLSDDNYSPIQRTLLLQFALKDKKDN